MKHRQSILVLAILLAGTATARANHPDVESWKHVANLSASGLLAWGLGALLRRKLGTARAIFGAAVAFLGLALVGWLVAVILSM